MSRSLTVKASRVVIKNDESQEVILNNRLFLTEFKTLIGLFLNKEYNEFLDRVVNYEPYKDICDYMLARYMGGKKPYYDFNERIALKYIRSKNPYRVVGNGVIKENFNTCDMRLMTVYLSLFTDIVDRMKIEG